MVNVYRGTQKQISMCCAIGSLFSCLKVSKLAHNIALSFSFRKGNTSQHKKMNYDLLQCLLWFAKSLLENVA